MKDEVVYASPKTDEERATLASACVRKLGIELPALLDGIQDGVERAYTGWPDRLYVIDQEGKVAFKTRPGPFGFNPKDMEDALKKELAKKSSAQAH